jgi:hypothetical protein
MVALEMASLFKIVGRWEIVTLSWPADKQAPLETISESLGDDFHVIFLSNSRIWKIFKPVRQRFVY